MKKVLFAVMCAVMLFGLVVTVYAERGDWRGVYARGFMTQSKGLNGGLTMEHSQGMKQGSSMMIWTGFSTELTA